LPTAGLADAVADCCAVGDEEETVVAREQCACHCLVRPVRHHLIERGKCKDKLGIRCHDLRLGRLPCGGPNRYDRDGHIALSDKLGCGCSECSRSLSGHAVCHDDNDCVATAVTGSWGEQRVCDVLQTGHCAGGSVCGRILDGTKCAGESALVRTSEIQDRLGFKVEEHGGSPGTCRSKGQAIADVGCKVANPLKIGGTDATRGIEEKDNVVGIVPHRARAIESTLPIVGCVADHYLFKA
jgi:hypothetical protein